MNRYASIALSLLALCGCVDDGRSRATVELLARGAASPVLVDGGWTITLTRADVAFGPAYLCATAAASSELCTTAVLEFLEAQTIDGLDPVPTPLGILEGVTGSVRSAQYDFGIPFLLTESMPTPLPGSVSGHSALLEATATDGVDSFDLSITLDVAAPVSGTTAIVGAPLVALIPESGATLTIAVDPREWLRGLDWAALNATPRGVGEKVVIATDSLDHDSVLRSMTVNHPPAFSFGAP